MEDEKSLRDVIEEAMPEEEKVDAELASTAEREQDSQEAGDEGGGTGDVTGADVGSGEPGIQATIQTAVEDKEQTVGAEGAKEDIPEVPVAEGKPSAVEEQPQPSLKAPNSWKPALREKWGSIPEEVQREILRREHDINRGLQEASGARQVANEFTEAVKPYMAHIQAENSTPIDALKSLFNTAHRLRTDPPAQKAEMVANLIAHYGVDVAALDQVLTARMYGGAPPQGGNGEAAPPSPGVDPATQQWLSQQLEPMNQFMQQVQQNQQQVRANTELEVQTEIEAFSADPTNEFFEDVREEMADLLELAAKRGQTLSLQDAYSRAIMARNDIADVVAKRRLEKAAGTATSDAQAARRAAVSVAGTPPSTGGQQVNPNASLRESIEAAWTSIESDV